MRISHAAAASHRVSLIPSDHARAFVHFPRFKPPPLSPSQTTILCRDLYLYAILIGPVRFYPWRWL